MQLQSVHQMEQLKVEIRRLSDRQTEESAHAQKLVQKLYFLSEEGRRVANEEKILKSLEFDEYRRRFTDVHKAHKKTFDWILKDSVNSETTSTHFRDWLQSQNGIYWISGKAGSGKSTLMKFITENETVNQCLQDWAGPSAESVLIPWFFWAAGSPLQRSIEGLFQSLLFQILRKYPRLIPIVCARRWQEDTVYGEKSDAWTSDELEEAFVTLEQQPMPGVRFCLFIDGLDEFEGNPNDIIEKLQSLVRSEGIKVCASSRPWTEFRAAFADGQCDGSLLLENHTKPDIDRFVRDILENSQAFTAAERRDSRYRTFIEAVIERAKGVFLWVYLVVKELLKGLGQRNKLEDLQKKLDTVPDDLEDYFRQIFDRVDKAHRTESAKVFLITTYSVQPLSVVCYRYLEEEHRKPGYALQATVQKSTRDQLTQIAFDVRDRLNFLCKDLIEINEVIKDNEIDYHVDFLHRTVKDFLMTTEMHQLLLRRATDNHTKAWNVHKALCSVQLARAKSLPFESGIRYKLNVLFSIVDEVMFYAREVEVELRTPELELLEDLDRVITDYANADMVYHWTNARDPPTGAYFNEDNHSNFLALAIQNRLVLYVKQKLDKTPRLLHSKPGRPLLDYALRPNLTTPTQLPHLVEFIDFEMVRMLLGKGADPNQRVHIYGNVTIWALFLLTCYEKKDIADAQTRGTWFQAAELMIRKGADRKLRLETTRRETIRGGSGSEAQAKTAKYKRVVQKGGMVEVDVPVDLTAMDIMEEVFGSDKMGEIEAIVTETRSWSVWNLLPWSS